MKQRAFKVLFLCALLIAATRSVAASDYLSTSELYIACGSVKKLMEKERMSSQENIDAVLCMHFLEGFEAGYMAHQTLHKADLPPVCIPRALSGGERALMFLKYAKVVADNYPENLGDPAAVSAALVLTINFPCKAE